MMRATDSSRASQVGIGIVPRVAIGVTLHNRAPYLREALDSLLSQTWPDLTVALVDDASSDGTEAIAREYQRRDKRVSYIRFPERQGMVAAWKAAFEHAVADGALYFAWGSDHDRWDPRWLQVLAGVLDAHPEVVLAYPLTQRIDERGLLLSKPARQFDTAGIDDMRLRWARFSRSDSVAAGDMVYGLMRVDAVRQAGIFRPVLCPDRLLMAELTLQGQIQQVPEVLWYRRQFPTGSVTRQRSTLFGPGMKVPAALTPPWYMHAQSLWATYSIAPEFDGERGRLAQMITRYAASYAWRHYSKTEVQRGALAVLGWPRWIYKRLKHAVLLGVYHVLMTRHRVSGKTR